MSKPSKRVTIAAVLMMASAMTAAQTDGPYEDPQAPDDEHVLFSGGISLEERAAAPDAGTRLEFFTASGAYLSDVHVVVEDSSGAELVDTVTEGPWLILDLPNGTYNVQASFEQDNRQSGMIEVGDTAQGQYGYMFPSLR
jgi:type 1 fimbria pilin